MYRVFEHPVVIYNVILSIFKEMYKSYIYGNTVYKCWKLLTIKTTCIGKTVKQDASA